MWPVVYAFGTRFSRYLVLPIAAVIGTVGYYVERKVGPKQAVIPYLETSIQDQRERRLASHHEVTSTVEEQRKGTLNLNSPVAP